MRTLRLVVLAIKHHWNAERSNPANLFAATFGMITNNIIIVWGLWAMLFDGKPDSQHMTLYFLSLNAMVTVAWGAICFFLGGLRSLGEFVEEGTLEPMLATPRDPLLLIAISRCQTPALGDVLQGCLTFGVLAYIAPFAMFARCIFFTLISGTAFLGLFILAGSVPFFVRRGNALAQLLVECNLSLSFYPTGQVFKDQGRLLLFLTPAAVTGLLPIESIDSGDLATGIASVLGAILFLVVAVWVFRQGLKRYQSASYVTVRT